MEEVAQEELDAKAPYLTHLSLAVDMLCEVVQYLKQRLCKFRMRDGTTLNNHSDELNRNIIEY